MTAEQLNDALELLAEVLMNLSKKKDLKEYFDKSDRESLLMLNQALKSARKAKSRSNAWLS